MTTILLIRHGHNKFVGKRLVGRIPAVQLNEQGRKQAQSVADFLKDAPIKAIYSSPLERAMETAQPLADQCNLPVLIHPGLIEVDFGDWQGKTIKQLARRKLWKIVQEKPAEMCFPGGETFRAAQERAAAALEEIAAQHDEKDMVVCFSHSDTIRLAVSHFLCMPLDAFQRVNIDTASITTLVLNKGKAYLANVNFLPGWVWPKPEEKKPEKQPEANV